MEADQRQEQRVVVVLVVLLLVRRRPINAAAMVQHTPPAPLQRAAPITTAIIDGYIQHIQLPLPFPQQIGHRITPRSRTRAASKDSAAVAALAAANASKTA